MDTLRERAVDGRHIALYAESYEGSFNLDPPSRPLPEDFDRGRIMIQLFPINRCYQHDMFDPACRELNRQYAWALDAWLKGPLGKQLIVGEYYNVSQYFDLAIGFSRVMDADLKRYLRRGVYGVHYMHVPNAAWGTRTLTQFQFARQLWNPAEDRRTIMREYLRRRYGRQAPAADRQVRLRLKEDCFLLRYTSLTLDLFLALARLWLAAKYGGRVGALYLQIDRLGRQLARLELPAGSCWKTAQPALERIRMKEVLSVMRAKKPVLEALSRAAGRR